MASTVHFLAHELAAHTAGPLLAEDEPSTPLVHHKLLSAITAVSCMGAAPHKPQEEKPLAPPRRSLTAVMEPASAAGPPVVLAAAADEGGGGGGCEEPVARTHGRTLSPEDEPRAESPGPQSFI